MNRFENSEFGQDSPKLFGNGTSIYRAFIPLVFMAFLLNYVESMVIPSIPDLQVSFGSTTAISSWLISAFLITGSVAAPLFGRLGDNYGKKRMLIVAISIYTFGVGFAGFSTSMGELILARALQGVGFGGIPLAFAIIIDIFPREKIAMAQGVMSGLFATGGVAGLVAGSYIMAYLGWQWAFHSALIVSVVILAAIILNVNRDQDREREKIDYLGAALLTSGITMILLYITRGADSGWVSVSNIGFLVGGAAMSLMFIAQERRSREPLIQLKLMSQRNIMVSNVVGILATLLMQIMFLSVVYFADDPLPFGDGFNNIQTGLVLAPGALSMAIVGPMLGRFIRRIGPKPLIAMGSVLLALGLVTFLLDRSSTLGLVLSGIAVWSGIVSIFVPTVNMIAMALPAERRAVGMGMNMMLRSIGGSVGPAVAASIMTLYSAPVIIPASSAASGISVQSFPTATAFGYLMTIGIVLAAIIVLINFATKNYNFRDRRE